MKFEPIKVLEEPKRSAPGWVNPTALFLADIAAGLLAFGASFLIVSVARDALDLNPITLASTTGTFHIALVVSLTAAVVLWFRSRGHYHQRKALSDQTGSIVTASVTGFLTSAAIQFATIEVGSRLLTILYWALIVPAIVVSRLCVRNTLKATGAWFKPAVMFTNQNRVRDLAAFMKKRCEVGVRVTHAISLEGLSAEAAVDAMMQARAKGMSILYAPPSGDDRQFEVIEHLVGRGVPFILSPELGPLPNHAEILDFPPEEISLIEVRDSLARPLALALKRGFDICVSALAFALCIPVLLPIIFAIRADGGPALFRQPRVGLKGEVFSCLKFRSMTLNAEQRLQDMIERDPAIAAEWRAYQKLKRDPRITRIGSFIRKTNLDELPQLINVLRGDMSLVGPRPMTVPQIKDYGPAFAAYKRMRPGITGLWQTNGRNETTFSERARLDAWYVRNWSLWRDVVILVRTVREVIFARGN